MENLIISTEATCDLPREILAENGIRCIDMNFFIEDDSFSTATDTVESSKLYESMREGKKTSTSQINSDIYYEYFKNLLKEGKTVFHLGFSSGLSSTYSTCQSVVEKINAEEGETKIYLIDSLCACSGFGLYTLLVSDFAKEASDINAVTEYADELRFRLCHDFTVDNLTYLIKGGRVSKSQAIVGNILHIKPVMYMDGEGRLSVVKKVISRRKSISSLAEKVVSNFTGESKRIFIAHADCLEDAKQLSKFVTEKTGIECQMFDLRPVIGCHSGPGTLSIYYLGNKR